MKIRVLPACPSSSSRADDGDLPVSPSVSLRASMCDSSNRRKIDRQRPWIKLSRDVTEVPLRHTAPKWRVGGWVGGLYVKLKEVGMDGKGTLKMFHRKKRELIKTPSISKKSRAGSPGLQSSAPAVSSASLLVSASVCVCVCVCVSDDLQLEGQATERAQDKW